MRAVKTHQRIATSLVYLDGHPRAGYAELATACGMYTREYRVWLAECKRRGVSQAAEVQRRAYKVDSRSLSALRMQSALHYMTDHDWDCSYAELGDYLGLGERPCRNWIAALVWRHHNTDAKHIQSAIKGAHNRRNESILDRAARLVREGCTDRRVLAQRVGMPYNPFTWLLYNSTAHKGSATAKFILDQTTGSNPAYPPGNRTENFAAARTAEILRLALEGSDLAAICAELSISKKWSLQSWLRRRVDREGDLQALRCIRVLDLTYRPPVPHLATSLLWDKVTAALRVAARGGTYRDLARVYVHSNGMIHGQESPGDLEAAIPTVRHWVIRSIGRGVPGARELQTALSGRGWDSAFSRRLDMSYELMAQGDGVDEIAAYCGMAARHYREWIRVHASVPEVAELARELGVRLPENLKETRRSGDRPVLDPESIDFPTPTKVWDLVEDTIWLVESGETDLEALTARLQVEPKAIANALRGFGTPEARKVLDTIFPGHR